VSEEILKSIFPHSSAQSLKKLMDVVVRSTDIQTECKHHNVQASQIKRRKEFRL